MRPAKPHPKLLPALRFPSSVLLEFGSRVCEQAHEDEDGEDQGDEDLGPTFAHGDVVPVRATLSVAPAQAVGSADVADQAFGIVEPEAPATGMTTPIRPAGLKLMELVLQVGLAVIAPTVTDWIVSGTVAPSTAS
jgi:hypothetical protein